MVEMDLIGEFERNLDVKGRLTMPASIRSNFGESVVVVPALDAEALYVFDPEGFKDWRDSLFADCGGFNARDREHQKLRRYLNSRAVSIDIDAASRISLSEALRSKFGIEREVTLVGNSDHLEIWDRVKWNEVNDDAEDLAGLFFNN